jgi:hypothetical protein
VKTPGPTSPARSCTPTVVRSPAPRTRDLPATRSQAARTGSAIFDPLTTISVRPVTMNQIPTSTASTVTEVVGTATTTMPAIKPISPKKIHQPRRTLTRHTQTTRPGRRTVPCEDTGSSRGGPGLPSDHKIAAPLMLRRHVLICDHGRTRADRSLKEMLPTSGGHAYFSPSHKPQSRLWRPKIWDYLGVGVLDIGVESMLAPFVRQADLCSSTCLPVPTPKYLAPSGRTRSRYLRWCCSSAIP